MSAEASSTPSATATAPAVCTNKKSCIPCESLDKSHLLTPSQITEALSSLPLWKLKDGDDNNNNNNNSNISIPKLSRSYTAKNFQSALNSINAIGTIAERENHHPDIHLTSYRDVEIVLYTHSIGGISANDVELARMLDEEVSVEYSPKWLRENPAARK